jgi:hypothetical protein
LSSDGWIGSAVVGLVGGASFGAVVSGWLAIRLKQAKRTQRRRAQVYVDVLAWIGARTQRWTDPHAAPLPKAPESRKTDPHEAASNATTDDTDPGSPFFVALRARLVAFGSHDMTRAFDHWVDAYRCLDDDQRNLTGSEALTPVDPRTALLVAGGVDLRPLLAARAGQADETPVGAVIGVRKHAQIAWLDEAGIRTLGDVGTLSASTVPRRRSFIVRVVAHPVESGRSWRDPGRSDGGRGCLTRAIEQCASKELRKG